MRVATLCKTRREENRETCGETENCKTKYACIVETYESTRKRMEGSPHRYHEDRIARKGMNSLCHCNLVHKFISMPQAMKIQDAKAAVEKMGKIGEDTGMESDESQKQKRGVCRSKE